MNPSDANFWDLVDALREQDGRYRREAYGFVVGALSVAASSLLEERRRDPIRRHLTGQELLSAVVKLARNEFGALASTVFGEWGVRSGEDVGHIVFQLVEVGQLSARPEDTLADFTGGVDLMKALGAEGSAPAPR